MIKSITAAGPNDTIGFKIRIELFHTDPSIWRLVTIPVDLNLRGLHNVIQITMGWEDDHLHQFKYKDTHCQANDTFGDFCLDFKRETEEEEAHTVKEFFKRKGSSIVYEYDFGDGWLHKITLEGRIKKKDDVKLFVLLDGYGACPPEDCGGIPGFYHLLETLSDPKHPEHEEMKEWIGEDYNPKTLNIAKINKTLKRSLK